MLCAPNSPPTVGRATACTAWNDRLCRPPTAHSATLPALSIVGPPEQSPDEGIFDVLDAVTDQVARLIEARDSGKLEQFALRWGPPNLGWRSLLHFILSSLPYEFGRLMFECEACGRLWLEADSDKDEWVSYQPESARRGILKQDRERTARIIQFWNRL